ncbi:MAG: GNAT family N-acetyltransferase [Candidatus Eisenbacteria bacterium]|nr:GNAT family N-acetyltransferase [Candidatus Latescibacterota bacterium]MBD3303084.1 GNAT family N-acetyltransferase [Candidatus Eisenbacteria bacterium]
MSGRFEYAIPTEEGAMDEVGVILTQSFCDQEEIWTTYRERTGDENFRTLRDGGEVVAACAILPCGQWFGGRVVPMGGIAAVGVPPHRRGRRYAERLMGEAVREMHRERIPLSVLYASSVALYRLAGYEPAGCRMIHSIDLRSIAHRKGEIPFVPVRGTPGEPVRAVAAERGRRSNGNVDRDDRFWVMLTKAIQKQPVFGYLLGSEAEPVGYVFFQQERKEWGYDLVVRDMAATTPEAMRALWSFLAAHRTMSRNASWPGPAVDPRLRGLAEPVHRILRSELWMLRIVDLRGALEQRGYPASLEAELHLEVADDLIEANNGRFMLRVRDGRGVVEPGGRGDLRIKIREMAPLYTGLWSAGDLTAPGAPDPALEEADRIFRGPPPWMADPF